MFMYLHKNKKGFTLIELMVVVAIIGILALLGLRVYTGQQQKAKESIVKANASTVHTLIQSELADGSISSTDILTEIGCATEGVCANMENPFGAKIVEVGTIGDTEGAGHEGVVIIEASSESHYLVNANDATGDEQVFTSNLEAMR